MGHSAKEIFDYSIQRAEHYIALYDILNDSRTRRGRQDWKNKFRRLMHWNQATDFYRIDGKGTNSILLLKADVGLTPEKFKHDYVSELLRAAFSSSVAAMDRYFHDLIVENCVRILGKSEAEMPSRFKSLDLSILVTKKALEKLRSKPRSRPNTIIKAELQKMLHRNYSFQSVRSLETAAAILGISNLWNTVGPMMNPVQTAEEIKNKITKISRRRNQIVHESDVVLKTSGKEISLRDIKKTEIDQTCLIIKEVVRVVDQLNLP